MLETMAIVKFNFVDDSYSYEVHRINYKDYQDLYKQIKIYKMVDKMFEDAVEKILSHSFNSFNIEKDFKRYFVHQIYPTQLFIDAIDRQQILRLINPNFPYGIYFSDREYLFDSFISIKSQIYWFNINDKFILRNKYKIPIPPEDPKDNQEYTEKLLMYLDCEKEINDSRQFVTDYEYFVSEFFHFIKPFLIDKSKYNITKSMLFDINAIKIIGEY